MATLPTAPLRAFRSDEFRDLARIAVTQGWDLYARPGGHVAAVNPRTGAQVTLSATAYAAHGVLVSKRQEFARAGLDLRSKAERRRSRQEARRMVHVPDTTPVLTTGPVEVVNKPSAHRAGGRFAITSREVLDIGGVEVKLDHRADGVWMASTRSPGYKRGIRQWQGIDRADLEARITRDLAATEAQEEEAAPAAPAPEPEPEAPEPPPAPAPVNGAATSAVHVVLASAEEFPLAAALDTLDARVAPALEALEAAGKGAAADLLRDELRRTDLESELLRLYRRVMSGD